MAEWHMPYASPQPIFEGRSQELNQVGYSSNSALLCTHCNEPFNEGEEGMEFLPGVAGVGTRSGQPMLIDSNHTRYQRATLHIRCIYEYVFEQPAEEGIYCAGCEAKISGEAD